MQTLTFGRRLKGQSDEQVGFEPALVRIADSTVATVLGKTHHANEKFNGNENSRVRGMVFEISDAEIESVDKYEATFFYERVTARLASGRQAWVYARSADNLD